MKKQHLWFILSLSCLACGCESSLTYEATCTPDETPICIDNKQYKCEDSGKLRYIQDGCGDIVTVILCEEDETKCSEGKQQICQKKDDGSYEWINTDKNCNVDCEEGYTKCTQGDIYTCTSDGKWPDKATTECGEIGCSEGTIQPASNPAKCFECGNDEVKCEENNLVVCNNHQLSKTNCENGCMQTETNAYCRECKDDELKCANSNIIGCAKDGENTGKWDDHPNKCEFGCFPGARGDEKTVTCYECANDTTQCIGGTTIQKCLSQKWYDVETCEFGCSDDADTKCYECKEDKYFHDAQGYCVKQKCENNQYQSPEPHEFSCNKDLTDVGECLNGNAKCEDGTFKFCLDGSWNSFGNCDSENECSILNGKACREFNSIGQICDNNKLKSCPNNASCKPDFSGCAECQNGTSKCQNNILKECKDGTYQETTCAMGTHCEVKTGKASCVKHDCENGTLRCQGSIIQECKNYQWETKNACGEGEQCQENGGVAACSCTSGTAYCDHTKAINCIDGQWQTTTCNITCSDVAGTAKCIECESGTKCQDETKIMTCQNNAWSAATSCADGMKCMGDTGNAKCACTTNQAKCDSKDNTKIIKCKADGTYGSAESCGTDKHCEGIAGSAICTADPMECSPGAKQCSGNDLQTCNDKGKWERAQTCDKGCANMACNECEGDEKVCDNGFIKTCENGQWKSTSCNVGCYDKTQCNVCPKGIKQCSGNKLQTCLGNKWQEEECEAGCFTVNANEATCNCSPGTVECVYSNNARVCNQNGEWENKSCPAGCIDNICKECQSDAEKCEDGNYFKCSNNGKWIDGKCEHGCNEETGKCYPECTPGQKKCEGKVSKTCDNKGNWDSNGTYCFNGCDINTGNCNNSAGVNCNTGETKCVSNKSMSVCIDNHWLTITCKSGDTCSDDKNKCINYSGGCTMGTCRAPGLPYAEIYLSIPCNHSMFDYSSIELCLSGCNTCYDNE